ncbi:hypothetical protein SAMN04515647_4386 [Cohaesibacter sp. ES.047]|uniref:hypothetical protein n=1 Tax=Cohaesibacter sp. ES.047 TaxID=1798205 RepID=UPI000BB7646A|nr:hypothetical protein [Cohaesibacter sp. ES.047]SNY94062.1 hypothetical protein SAMN04515647_4386 [Cohaesibacter sp. ES.047]
MAEAKKYRVVGNRKEVGGIKVVRGHVEMSAEKARYHVAIGRLVAPSAAKNAKQDAQNAKEPPVGAL